VSVRLIGLVVAGVLALAGEVGSAGWPHLDEVHRVPTGAGDAEWVARMRLDQAHRSSTGAGVTIGLVDTGVDPAAPSLAAVLLPGAEFPDLGQGAADFSGHGTTMALLVHEVAPEAKVLPARLNGGGDANAAIRWVVDQGATVVNLSLGSGVSGSAAFDDGLRYAAEHDVVVVAAAGNASTDRAVTSPADRPGVLAVSAVDGTGRFAEAVSVEGPEVMLAAPGVDIATAGRPATSGTSQAAAITSGVAALVRSRFPGLDATETAGRLIGTAADAGPAGRDDQYGYGVVDPVAALSGEESRTPWWVWTFVAVLLVVTGSTLVWRRRRQRPDGAPSGR
jgi:subtilisin family serine protease